MARAVIEIEREIRALKPAEQEELLRVLLEELDGPTDPDVERAWLDEVQRRSGEMDAGTVQAVPGRDPGRDVFDRARARLKQ